MSLRKFLDHKIAPLLMSGADDGGAGAGGTGGGTGGTGGGAPTTISFASDKPFVDQLPEQYRKDAAFADIKNFEGFVSQFVNQKKMLGDRANLLALPKDGDAQGWNDLYNKLGRPEAADKYNLGKRGEDRDYSDFDKAFHAKILPAVHAAGVTQKQLDAIVPVFNAYADEVQGASLQSAQDYATGQLGGLKKEWGAKYDENMSDAQAALQHLSGGDKDLLAQLNMVKDGKATGDNAGLLKVFAKLGAGLREDGVIGRGGDNGGGGVLEPAQAKTQIAALMKNADFVKVWKTKGATGKVDGKDLTHDDAVGQLGQLYAFAYPEQQ